MARLESKKPEDDNSFAQRCKLQIEYEKSLVPYSEELRKAREDFKKAYLEERESVRVKMCEASDAWDEAKPKSAEYYAEKEKWFKFHDLYMSMGRDFFYYTKCRN